MHDADYSFMESAIQQFMFSYGVKIVLSKTVCRGTLNVYLYNWIGNDDRFYSLLVPCSANAVYSWDASEFMQSSDRLWDAMCSNLKVFGTKDEWDREHWTADFAKGYAKSLEKVMLNYHGSGVKGGYQITGVQLHVQPMPGISVWYQKDIINCITVWCGYTKRVFTADRKHAEFLESLNFGSMLEVVTMKQPSVLALGGDYAYNS